MRLAFLPPTLAGSPSFAHRAPVFLPVGSRCMVGGCPCLTRGHLSAGYRGSNKLFIHKGPRGSSQAWTTSLHSKKDTGKWVEVAQQVKAFVARATRIKFLGCT